MLYIVENIGQTYGAVSSEIPVIQGIFKSEEKAEELRQALSRRYHRAVVRVIATDFEVV